MLRKIFIILIVFLSVSGYKFEKPMKLTTFDNNALIAINNALEQLWDMANGRYDYVSQDLDVNGEITTSSGTIVIAKSTNSWSATLAFPDSLQSEIDNWEFKKIDSAEFPNGVVITKVLLDTSASSTYAINVENWDDPTTINATNPTIVAIATSSSTEASETTITYSTIAAGQIIMLDLPTTDIGWIHIELFYYEPSA